MDYDHTFRLILLAGFGLVLPFGLYHRIKAHAGGDKLDRRAEGWFILATLRPAAMVAMIGLIAFLINPQWMRWSSLPLPIWLRWVGVGLGAAGGVLLIVVFRFLGTNLTDTVVTRTEHTLVTHGPYRYVRHPFYLAFIIAVAANALVTANWFIGLFGIIAWLLIVKRTRIEEDRLVARFGDDYRTYMQHTGRFFPRFGR